MKVEPSAQQQPPSHSNRVADAAYKASSTDQSTSRPQAGNHDTVAISSQAERIHELLSLLTQDARPTANDQVEALRNAVQSGAYEVDLTRTASAMIDIEKELTDSTPP